MAAAGNIHAGIIQRKFFQIPQKSIVIFALTVIQRIARVIRFGIVCREDAAQVVAIRRVQGKRWVCAVKILLAVSIQLAEHGAVMDVVAMDHMAQTVRPAGGIPRRADQTAIVAACTGKAAAQVIVGIFVLHHRQRKFQPRHTEPCGNVRVLLFQRGKVQAGSRGVIAAGAGIHPDKLGAQGLVFFITFLVACPLPEEQQQEHHRGSQQHRYNKLGKLRCRYAIRTAPTARLGVFLRRLTVHGVLLSAGFVMGTAACGAAGLPAIRGILSVHAYPLSECEASSPFSFFLHTTVTPTAAPTHTMASARKIHITGLSPVGSPY